MSWRRQFAKIGALVRWVKPADDLAQEIRAHLEMEERENREAGMPPEEAHFAALRRFGNVTQAQESSREMWKWQWLETLLQDIRYGLRQLRRNPGFTAVGVITLALGIGANTAIFSVVNGVLLAPLPYGHQDRLAVLWESLPRTGYLQTDSYPNFRDWQLQSRSFPEMAAWRGRSYDLTAPGFPEHLDGNEVSWSFFSTVGVRMVLGRGFTRQEDRQGGARVVVVSNRLWRERLVANRQVLGKNLMLSGIDYSIVGVLPRDFRFFGRPDVYTPLGQGKGISAKDRGEHAGIGVVGLLSPGMSLIQAQAEMDTIQNHLDRLYPDADGGLGVKVFSLKEQIVGSIGGTLLLLLGAVGFVLLIACSNVANLLLARAMSRTREFVIRSALGASQARLVRQLLTESVLLSLAGGSLGLLIATWGVKTVLRAVPGHLPRTEDIHLNLLVLLFCLGVTVGAGLLFGLIPSMKTSKPNMQENLKGSRLTFSGGTSRTQSTLVVLQVALTLVLLVGAGLLLRTIRHLWQTNPGFESQNLVTFKVGLSPSLTKTASATRAAYRQLLGRIRAIPGVKTATMTMMVPLEHMDVESHFWFGPRRPSSLQETPQTLMFLAGPDYLRTMGIPLLEGRFFTAEDEVKSTPVIVIDSVFAHAYFRGKDPVGKTVTFDPINQPCQIIGVVGHVRHWGLGKPSAYSRAQSYFPLDQVPAEFTGSVFRSVTVIIRTPLSAATVMPAIRQAVYGTGQDQPVYAVQTMQEIVSKSMASQRFPMVLLSGFAVLALLLASVGIYGVISYSVSQRTHEIGIRMALGAHKNDVLKMIVRQGLKLALIGVGVGVAGALGLTRFLSSMLYGVKSTDPLTFAAVALILIAIALAACYLPARRAAKVDPMVALRYE